MDDTRKQFTGQTADAKYPLLEYLGGSRHSSVFRTEVSASPSAPSATEAAARTKAAIKIIPAATGSAETQLNRWRQAERFSHPNLVKIYDSGECRLGEEDFLYVVEEFADEDLSQILPQRALTADETRGMLAATLDALFYLHSKGLVHGHLSPANIMAIGDEIKLSSDGIVRAGERLSDSGRLSPYDPPEAASGRISTAADMWSLGMTLAEVLTQKLPIWERLGREEPRLPESMPQPFANIARRCLQRDPKMRWNVEQVASALPHTLLHHVDPPLKARAAVASIGAAAASVLSETAPKGESRRPAPSRRDEAIKPSPQPALGSTIPRERPAGTNLAVAVGAIALLAIAILEVPRLLKHDPHAHAASANAAASSSEPPSDGASSNSAAPPASGSSTPAPNNTAAAPSAARPSRSVAKPPAEKSAPGARPTEKVVKSPAPPKSASAAAPSSASSESDSAAITHREIPSVSQKSLATITGTVRVVVRVRVADDGSVSDASFDHEGPSAYFSRVAMNATRDWKFSPGAPRAWVLHFQFTSAGAKAEATPATN